MARRNNILIILKAVDNASKVVRKVRREVDTLTRQTNRLGLSNMKQNRRITDSYKEMGDTFKKVGKQQRTLHSILGGEYRDIESELKNVTRSTRKAINYMDGIPVSTRRGSQSMKEFSKETRNVGNNLKRTEGMGSHFGRGLSLWMGLDILSGFKEWTYDLAQTREKLELLTRSTMDAKDASQDYFNMMDQMTYGSIVQLDDLAGAIESVRTTANFTDEQIIEATPIIMRLGEIDLLKGHDRNHAFRMMESYAKGLTGKTSMLNTQMDITQGVLQQHGYQGDVDSYNKAMKSIVDRYEDLNEVMDSNYGLQLQASKYWRLAGRDIGKFFLPPMNEVYKLIIELGKQRGTGEDATSNRWVLSLGMAFAGLGSTLMTVAPSLHYTKGILGDILGMFTTRLPGGSYGKFIEQGGLNLGKKSRNKYAGLKKGIADFAAGYAAGGFSRENLVPLGKAKAKQAGAKVGGKMKGALMAPFAMLGDVLGVSAAGAAELLAVLAAIAAVVFTLGQEFGWWKDLPTMFKAMGDGAKRLWEAFKNSKTAHSLHELLQKIAVLIGKIFNHEPGSTWDVIQDLINLFGKLDEILSTVIDKINWILDHHDDINMAGLGPAGLMFEAGNDHINKQISSRSGSDSEPKTAVDWYSKKRPNSILAKLNGGGGPVSISAPPRPVAPVTIINVNDGAFQLDARNWDTQQCKRVFINTFSDMVPNRSSFSKS